MATTPTPLPRLLARAPSPPTPTLRLPRSTLRPPRIPLLSATSQDTNSSGNKDQEPPPTAASGEAAKPAEEQGSVAGGGKSQEAVAAELKEALRARKLEAEGAGGEGWWDGVAEEMTEIEWPAAGKVVGTTGVVLAVIAGSTAALLSVNALLAELSDRVFAGRGLQDFFAG